jgi:hypothetical protein
MVGLKWCVYQIGGLARHMYPFGVALVCFVDDGKNSSHRGREGETESNFDGKNSSQRGTLKERGSRGCLHEVLKLKAGRLSGSCAWAYVLLENKAYMLQVKTGFATQ